MSRALGNSKRESLFLKKAGRILVVVLLVLAPLAVYWQVGGHEFVNFDDDDYIFQNLTVKSGMNIQGVCWAFSFTESSYWHPLTWISHMLDCQFFGLDAGKHHLVNLLFHQVNVILLFAFLSLTTGAAGRSAFAAALFALHPINVDTVAWVSERKNLLSTTLWLVTMLSYLYYVKKPGVLRYGALLLSFVLGLLAKPMLVTLPFVLLLLDYWPLRRFSLMGGDEGKKARKGSRQAWYQGEPLSRLISEKAPLLVLSLIMVALSSHSIKSLNAVVSFEAVPLGLRIANGIVSYAAYLLKIAYPANLTFYYPYPTIVPGWQIAGAAVLIGALTYLAFRCARTHPYGIVGWLWYMGTLVPVLGIIQGGLWPAIAERWAYVPIIGVSIVLSWAGADLVSGAKYRRFIAPAACTLILGILSCLTYIQAGYWRNDFTLCTRALEINPDNYVAHNNLGIVFKNEGNNNKAAFHYREALRISPANVTVQSNLANALMGAGLMDEAVRHYREALKLSPDEADIHFNLGAALEKMGRTEDAARSYRQAFALNPHLELPHDALGNVRLAEGKFDEAIRHYLTAIKENPASAVIRYNLGNAYASKGEMEAAVRSYSDAIDLDKRYAEAYNNMGNALAMLGKNSEAISCYKKAIEIKPGFGDAVKNCRIIESREGPSAKK